MPMNVILLERVPKLGQMGDVVKVKPGFARNYLLPQKKALRATKDNITYFESQRKVLEAQNLERRSEAERAGEKVKEPRHERDGCTSSVLPSPEDLPVLRRQRAEDRLQGHQAAGPVHFRAWQDRPEPHHRGLGEEAA